MSLENTWHLRRVADNASRACWICYKPSTSVLITPNNKPDADEATSIAEKKKKQELDKTIEEIKKEFEEKEKLKREKRKGKGKDKDKDAKTKTEEEDEDKQDEKAKDEKIRELSKAKDEAQVELGPRIYHLNKNFYQMRLDKLRNAEIAKRNRERLNNPSNFPSVPSGNP